MQLVLGGPALAGGGDGWTRVGARHGCAALAGQGSQPSAARDTAGLRQPPQPARLPAHHRPPRTQHDEAGDDP